MNGSGCIENYEDVLHPGNYGETVQEPPIGSAMYLWH